MKIFIFLALVTAICAHTRGIMGIDFSASKDVNATLKIGLFKFELTINEHGSRHLSFHPSALTADAFFPMSIGLAHSKESTQDVMLRLLPGCVQKVVEFANVTITLKVNFTCPDGLAGLRCAVKIDKNRGPVSHSDYEYNEKNSMSKMYNVVMMVFSLTTVPIGVVISVFLRRMVDKINTFMARRALAQYDCQKHMIFTDIPAYSEINAEKDLSNKLVVHSIEEPAVTKDPIV